MKKIFFAIITISCAIFHPAWSMYQEEFVEKEEATFNKEWVFNEETQQYTHNNHLLSRLTKDKKTLIITLRLNKKTVIGDLLKTIPNKVTYIYFVPLFNLVGKHGICDIRNIRFDGIELAGENLIIDLCRTTQIPTQNLETAIEEYKKKYAKLPTILEEQSNIGHKHDSAEALFWNREGYPPFFYGDSKFYKKKKE